VIAREAGVDPIVQITGRDRNRIALQADVLGAAALGIEHFVFMSGDDPKQGNHPDAVNVKDLDGIGLVKMAASLRDKAQFLSGDEIKEPPQYTIGATASPFTKPMESDLRKTTEKIAAGADFIQTQPVFDLATFSQWLAEVRRLAGRRRAASERSPPQPRSDRKSTRLNSSHASTSYAVFCLQTKTTRSPPRPACHASRCPRPPLPPLTGSPRLGCGSRRAALRGWSSAAGASPGRRWPLAWPA